MYSTRYSIFFIHCMCSVCSVHFHKIDEKTERLKSVFLLNALKIWSDAFHWRTNSYSNSPLHEKCVFYLNIIIVSNRYLLMKSDIYKSQLWMKLLKKNKNNADTLDLRKSYSNRRQIEGERARARENERNATNIKHIRNVSKFDWRKHKPMKRVLDMLVCSLSLSLYVCDSIPSLCVL